MQVWDLISVGLGLIGSSIAVADTIIVERLSGGRIVPALFLLLTSAFLVELSASLFVFSILKNPPGDKKAFLCGTLL
jgi:hypothetical protein